MDDFGIVSAFGVANPITDLDREILVGERLLSEAIEFFGDASIALNARGHAVAVHIAMVRWHFLHLPVVQGDELHCVGPRIGFETTANLRGRGWANSESFGHVLRFDAVI